MTSRSENELYKKLDRIAHEFENTRWPAELEDESYEVYQSIRELQEKLADNEQEEA